MNNAKRCTCCPVHGPSPSVSEDKTSGADDHPVANAGLPSKDGTSEAKHVPARGPEETGATYENGHGPTVDAMRAELRGRYPRTSDARISVDGEHVLVGKPRPLKLPGAVPEVTLKRRASREQRTNDARVTCGQCGDYDDGPYVCPAHRPPEPVTWRVLVNEDGEPYAVENGTSRRGVDTSGKVERPRDNPFVDAMVQAAGGPSPRPNEAVPAGMCESCETRPVATWCRGCLLEDFQVACGCPKCVTRDEQRPGHPVVPIPTGPVGCGNPYCNGCSVCDPIDEPMAYIHRDGVYQLVVAEPCGQRINVPDDPCGLEVRHGGPCIRRSNLAARIPCPTNPRIEAVAREAVDKWRGGGEPGDSMVMLAWALAEIPRSETASPKAQVDVDLFLCRLGDTLDVWAPTLKSVARDNIVDSARRYLRAMPTGSGAGHE